MNLYMWQSQLLTMNPEQERFISMRHFSLVVCQCGGFHRTRLKSKQFILWNSGFRSQDGTTVDEPMKISVDPMILDMRNNQFKKIQVAQRATIAHLRTSKSSKYFNSSQVSKILFSRLIGQRHLTPQSIV